MNIKILTIFIINTYLELYFNKSSILSIIKKLLFTIKVFTHLLTIYTFNIFKMKHRND